MTFSISNQELRDKPDLKAGDVIDFHGEKLTVQASEGDGSMLYVVTSGGGTYLVGMDGKDIR